MEQSSETGRLLQNSGLSPSLGVTRHRLQQRLQVILLRAIYMLIGQAICQLDLYLSYLYIWIVCIGPTLENLVGLLSQMRAPS